MDVKRATDTSDTDNTDQKYKRKWEDQNRHPKYEKHHYRIGNNVLSMFPHDEEHRQGGRSVV